MLTAYIEAAMRHAEYEDLGDEGWFGRIPGLQGLWACEATLEKTQRELRSALEDWILISLRLGDQLAVIDGIDINVKVEGVA